MGNWDRKEELTKKAVEHTKFMEEFFKKYAKDSISEIAIFDENYANGFCPAIGADVNTQISVKNIDSVTAIFDQTKDISKIAVLDFASFKEPGGKFIEGSKAQEECLCHASNLYNILSSKAIMNDYYNKNTGNTYELYKNKMIIIQKIIYLSPDKIKYPFNRFATTIVCAAPNVKAAKNYFHVEDHVCEKAIYDRISYMLRVVSNNENISTLILGAFGCGVFGNDPILVAKCFKYVIETELPHRFKNIVFAIPGNPNTDANYLAFKQIFG